MIGRRAIDRPPGALARRQLAAWTEAGPWVALLAIALPLGALLSHVTRMWSDGSVVYLKAYVEGFTWTYLANPGSRQDLVELAAWLLSNVAALCVWSWTAGFALARLSRRTLWLAGALFAVALTVWTARGVESSVTFDRSNAWAGPGPDTTWGLNCL